MTVSNLSASLQKSFLEQFPADAANLLETVTPNEAIHYLLPQSANVTAKVIEHLSPLTICKLLPLIPTNQRASILNLVSAKKLALVFAAKDMGDLSSDINHLNTAKREAVSEFLHYTPGSAGYLMDTQIVFYHKNMTVKETLSKFKQSNKTGRRLIFLIDENRHPQGLIEVQDLLMVAPGTRLSELAKSIPIVASDISPIEEVIEHFDKYKLSELPIVNFEGQLIGILRYDALVEAARQDASVDIQTMVGASKDERALSNALFAVKKRLPWLEINLLTAFIAASVVGMFESTIAQYTALAILLPVVAGQSGNTGAQALAVTMRGLALREVRPSHWPQIVWKEANVGLVNGIAVALTTALGVYVWSDSAGLAMIIGSSMVISMLLASVAGASVPVVLAKLGQDPAQSSSIILTTITDVVGFFSFLSIATLMSSLI